MTDLAAPRRVSAHGRVRALHKPIHLAGAREFGRSGQRLAYQPTQPLVNSLPSSTMHSGLCQGSVR